MLPLEGFSLNFIFEYFFEDLSRKLSFHCDLTRITGTLREDQCTFVIISRSVLLNIRNVSYKSRKENQNTNFMFNNFFFSKFVPFVR